MENVLYRLLGGTNFPVTKDFSKPREEAEMKISEQNIVLLIRGKSLKVLKSFFFKSKLVVCQLSFFFMDQRTYNAKFCSLSLAKSSSLCSNLSRDANK